MTIIALLKFYRCNLNNSASLETRRNVNVVIKKIQWIKLNKYRKSVIISCIYFSTLLKNNAKILLFYLFLEFIFCYTNFLLLFFLSLYIYSRVYSSIFGAYIIFYKMYKIICVVFIIYNYIKYIVLCSFVFLVNVVHVTKNIKTAPLYLFNKIKYIAFEIQVKISSSVIVLHFITIGNSVVIKCVENFRKTFSNKNSIRWLHRVCIFI